MPPNERTQDRPSLGVALVRSWPWLAGGGDDALAEETRGDVLSDAPRQVGSYPGLHHGAKVRRVIQLFMNGGVSQVDTFDYKPALQEQHGKQVDFGIAAAATSVPGAVMKSPFEFQQYGECGRWVSDVLPEMAKRADRLVPDGDAFEDQRTWSRELLAKHRFLEPRLPVARIVDLLWTRTPHGRVADILSCCPIRVACPTTTRATSVAVLCRRATRRRSLNHGPTIRSPSQYVPEPFEVGRGNGVGAS
ncbi:MAG: DUF1501 domain-containing protein [Pirellulaceae bacterium]